MKFNFYYPIARVLPAIFSAIPLIIFNFYYLDQIPSYSTFLSNVFEKKIVGQLTLLTICLLIFAETCRILGKVFERWYFDNELKMPTTNFLLFSDTTYSEDRKNKLRSKILSDFKIRLPSKEDEKTVNSEIVRQAIVEAVSHIKTKLRKNAFLLKHNIEYGACRNILGGAVIGLLLSSINIIFLFIFQYLLQSTSVFSQ